MPLRPTDVGRRVSIRRVVGTQANGRPLLSDVVGDLLSWDAGTLTVRRRDGSLVEMDETSIVAGRVVPPAPPRRAPRRR